MEKRKKNGEKFREKNENDRKNEEESKKIKGDS